MCKAIRIVFAVAVLLLPSVAFAACGEKGGSGYRAANGRCVGFDNLNRICGDPPTLRCKRELTDGGRRELTDGGRNPVWVYDSCHGCSCQCGPGFRLPDQNCASWKQHRQFMTAGGYLSGTIDELGSTKQPPSCPAEMILQRRRALTPAAPAEKE
jgi:hypothetical protein